MEIQHIVFHRCEKPRASRGDQAASVAGILLLVFDDDLGRGISMFYIGGVACYLVEAIAAGKVPRVLIGVIAFVADAKES